jgi:simple sugar transport system permease protein
MFIVKNSVTILFIAVCAIGIYYSQLSSVFITNELVNRIARNFLLVMSLIIPIRAGMGLNFSIVIGAMAAQISIFTVMNTGVGGIGGFLLAGLLMTPLAIIFGYLIGIVLNKCKGQEMIAGMMLAFFAEGLYQLLFLFLIGGVIPVRDKSLILSNGIGVKNSIDLTNGIKYAIDSILKIPLSYFLMTLGILGICYLVFRFWNEQKRSELHQRLTNEQKRHAVMFFSIIVMGFVVQVFAPGMQMVGVPIATGMILIAFYSLNELILKTKMGQDFKAIGQSRMIAKTAGIDVNRTRIKAIILSTLFAAYGQLIFLQNIGTINTYGSHTQVGLFSCAAILIGGASLTQANGKQALLGLILFHTLFIVSPIAGKNLFGEPQIGEYFRVFITYGVIGISLAVYAWQKYVSGRQDFLRQEASHE